MRKQLFRGLVSTVAPLVVGCHRATPTDAQAFQPFDAARCDTAVASGRSEDGMIGMAAPGPHGVLAWSAGRRPATIHLDAGGHDATAGRNGEGPGEFRSIGVAWWVGDTLWVSDYRLGRSVAFTADGRYAGTLTPPMPGSWVRTASGRSVGVAQTSVSIPDVRILAFGPDQRLDTLADVAAPDTFRAGDPHNAGPFTMRLALAAWTPDGARWCVIVPGQASDLHLQCLDPAGNAVLDTTVTLPPRAVTQEEYDTVMASMVKGLDPIAAARLRADTPRPPFFAAAFEALMDNHDRFWVLRSTLGERPEVWTELSPTGAVVRTMTLPAAMHLLAARDDLLYLRAAQDDGFQTLLRCQL